MTKEIIEKENKTYRVWFHILKFIVLLFYPYKSSGWENMPDRSAILCANHSNYIDPFLIAAHSGQDAGIRFMAKIELSRIPVLGYILKRLGVIFIDRKTSDLNAIRATIKYLKADQKVFIFPEGTRSNSENSVSAKTGAIRIAAKTGAPIVPIYIPRDKKLFSKGTIIMGKPYFISKTEDLDLEIAADELMEKIRNLQNEAVS
ncbi:MAG: 1-acyl-sn-glycerol-3-phosphate acyltransferase [Ruminococcaceae bacterium]|nr:1-acyl-sn-glycerol-3-phosphate acyltransferase [Oscillospiraceae bacterium]